VTQEAANGPVGSRTGGNRGDKGNLGPFRAAGLGSGGRLMPFLVKCPNSSCGKKYSVPDTAVGHTLRCKACDTRFNASPPEPRTGEDATPPAAGPPVAPGGPSGPATRRAVPLLRAGGLLALAVAVGWILSSRFHHGASKSETPPAAAAAAPKGPPPTLAVLSLDPNGASEWWSVEYRVETRAEKRQVENHVEEVRLDVLVPYQKTTTVAVGDLLVSDGAGRRLGTEEARQALSRPRTVLLSADGEDIDPFYLEVFQKGLLRVRVPGLQNAYPARAPFVAQRLHAVAALEEGGPVALCWVEMRLAPAAADRKEGADVSPRLVPVTMAWALEPGQFRFFRADGSTLDAEAALADLRQPARVLLVAGDGLADPVWREAVRDDVLLLVGPFPAVGGSIIPLGAPKKAEDLKPPRPAEQPPEELKPPHREVLPPPKAVQP
jgi:hypothetical protein